MVQDLRTIGFQELIAFVEVVKQGGITAAASELGIAKSAVSNQVTKLEQRLNVKLLNRHSRRVSLTKQGEHLLPRIESMLAEGERLFQEAELEENLPKGVVRIAATPEFSQFVLVHFIPLVQQKYPDINIILKTAYNFEDMQDPAFDFAFRINRVKDERLVAKEIGQFHRRFYANPTLANIEQLNHPAEVTHYPCLGFSSSTTKPVWSTRNKKTDETQEIAISANTSVLSFNILAELAASGQGICYIPSFVVSHYRENGSLIHLLPDWQSSPAKVFLAYRYGSDRIARVRAVLDLAKECLPKLIESKFA
ncbi:LysR family transcriptional regulator [Aliikangiella marina]|uniref:LysR family transcriptional regulator n=1 Tax=Aliikangiella marina TaxID=1712262 RepID=A0A545TC61_9GAMM|nr:LysR family transcriptional regulator [Aliikangiella marina]TQV74794.1 LysR family transcriptional regulator [Aliikangiella marina]